MIWLHLYGFLEDELIQGSGLEKLQVYQRFKGRGVVFSDEGLSVAFVAQRWLLQAEEKHSVISLSSDSAATLRSFSGSVEC